jgi:hypothetical protein
MLQLGESTPPPLTATHRRRSSFFLFFFFLTVHGADVVAHFELPRGLLRDQQVVARDHLHRHAVPNRLVDGGLGVGPRRVEEGQEAQHVVPDGNVREKIKKRWKIDG